jgi:hypothetical protein
VIFFLSGKKGQNLDRRDTSNISVKTSIAMKSILASFFLQTGGMSRKLNRVSKHDSVILMYHRVVPHDEVRSGIQAGMYVEPYTFERHLGFLKKHFVIVPISALLSDYEEVSGSFSPSKRLTNEFVEDWVRVTEFPDFSLWYRRLPKRSVQNQSSVPMKSVGKKTVAAT